MLEELIYLTVGFKIHVSILEGGGYLIRGLGHKIRCLGKDFRNIHCFDLKTLPFYTTKDKC